MATKQNVFKDGLSKLSQELDAMQSPEKWAEYEKEKNKDFTGQLDTQKSMQVSDWLTNNFIRACNNKNVYGKFIGWNKKQLSEKVTIVQTVVNNVLELIRSDIKTGNVDIYTHGGKKYIKQDDFIDRLFKENISAGMAIKVINDKNVDLMGVNNLGELLINFDFIMYGMPDCILMDLRHEMMHVVDIFFPNISAISPEILIQANRYYHFDKKDLDLYENNPLELNAQMKRSDYAKRIQEALKLQEKQIQMSVSHSHD